MIKIKIFLISRRETFKNNLKITDSKTAPQRTLNVKVKICSYNQI